MIEQNEKKQGKLVYYIIAITFLIIAVLSSLQVLVVKERAKKSVAASYEEDCRRITDAYADVVSIRLSEYIKQMRMYTEADVTKTVDPVEIQSWLIEHASSRTPDFDRIGFIDSSGDFYNDQNSMTNVADRGYFDAIMRQGRLGARSFPISETAYGTKSKKSSLSSESDRISLARQKRSVYYYFPWATWTQKNQSGQVSLL